MNSSDLPGHGSKWRKIYKIRVFLMVLEKGEFSKLFCLRGDQMIYFGEGRVCLGDCGWAGTIQINYKTISFKTVFKDSPNELRIPSIECFWKSIYCITQKMHISESVRKMFLKELAIFLNPGKIFKKLLELVTFLRMLLFHRCFPAIF